MNTFLSKLPLTNEEEEAQKSHQLLIQQIIANNQNVINDANKPQVLAALQRIRETYETKKDEIEILNEEGLQLLSKLAWKNHYKLLFYIINLKVLLVRVYD